MYMVRGGDRENFSQRRALSDYVEKNLRLRKESKRQRELKANVNSGKDTREN